MSRPKIIFSDASGYFGSIPDDSLDFTRAIAQKYFYWSLYRGIKNGISTFIISI